MHGSSELRIALLLASLFLRQRPEMFAALVLLIAAYLLQVISPALFSQKIGVAIVRHGALPAAENESG